MENKIKSIKPGDKFIRLIPTAWGQHNSITVDKIVNSEVWWVGNGIYPEDLNSAIKSLNAWWKRDNSSIIRERLGIK